MIKYSQIRNIFEQLNIRIEEFKAEVEEEDISTPFLVYSKTEAETLGADSTVYFKSFKVNALLIVDEITDISIALLEQLLIENEVYYTQTIEYSDSERVFEIMYSFTVIDG